MFLLMMWGLLGILLARGYNGPPLGCLEHDVQTIQPSNHNIRSGSAVEDAPERLMAIGQPAVFREYWTLGLQTHMYDQKQICLAMVSIAIAKSRSMFCLPKTVGSLKTNDEYGYGPPEQYVITKKSNKIDTTISIEGPIMHQKAVQLLPQYSGNTSRWADGYSLEASLEVKLSTSYDANNNLEATYRRLEFILYENASSYPTFSSTVLKVVFPAIAVTMPPTIALTFETTTLCTIHLMLLSNLLQTFPPTKKKLNPTMPIDMHQSTPPWLPTKTPRNAIPKTVPCTLPPSSWSAAPTTHVPSRMPPTFPSPQR